MIKKYILVTSILVAAIFLATCKKDYDIPTGSNKVELAAFSVDTISYFHAKVSSHLINTGNNNISSCGFCWSTQSSPDISTTKIDLGSISSAKNFSSDISDLQPDQKYYIRAFAVVPGGFIYSSLAEFTTLKTGKPHISADSIFNMSYSTAQCRCFIKSDSGLAVTARGVCWSKNQNPSITDEHTSDGTGMGLFTASIINLSPNTTYYIRAYATNSFGTSYGQQKSFTTNALTIPLITTAAVSAITQTTALSGGNVSSDGGSVVTTRGICWSITSNPTNAGSHTSDGSGTGAFSSNLSPLNANTLYHIRSFATNSLGTAYGSDLVFTTLANPVAPSVNTTAATNISQTSATSGGNVTSDGGITVTARGVCWSISANPSVATSHTTNGTGIGIFNSNLTGLTANATYHVRAYATNTAGTSYGSDLTFTTLTNPVSPSVSTTAATSISQATATSGGNVTSDGGSSVSARGVCWSTSANPITSTNHTTDGSGTGIFTSSLTGLAANTTYHVRAYAINLAGTSYGSDLSFITSSNPVAPTITTTAASAITQTTATSGGNVSSDGGATVTARGICWNISSGPTVAGGHTSNGTGTGVFTGNLSGLTAGTLYYIRAYATNSVGTSYGSQLSFTTAVNYSIGLSYGGGIIFYIDGTGQHGLIASSCDLTLVPSGYNSFLWGCLGTNQNTTSGVGTGQANTTKIINGCSTAGIAARICNDLVLNGYDDWFLPSKDELSLIKENLVLSGIGYAGGVCWSSSEYSANSAWSVGLYINGSPSAWQKDNYEAVRAVRAF